MKPTVALATEFIIKRWLSMSALLVNGELLKGDFTKGSPLSCPI